MNTLQKCKSCGSANIDSFGPEMAIHHAGRANLSKPHVWLFPELLVCFDCGVALLTVPEDKLRQLAESRELVLSELTTAEEKERCALEDTCRR